MSHFFNELPGIIIGAVCITAWLYVNTGWLYDCTKDVVKGDDDDE